MSILFLLIYLGFCILVASAAKNVAIGFWGVLAMSIFLTPLLTAILVLILRPRARPPKKKEWETLEEDY